MSEEFEIPQKMRNDFDEYLTRFQEDFVKIIGAHKKKYHILSDDEMLSETNFSLMRKKDNIINYYKEDFNLDNFKKSAYVYCRNLISWTSSNEFKNKWNSKRSDGTIITEDGEKSFFENLIEQEGEPEQVEKQDKLNKVNSLIKTIEEYSTFLNEKEIEVFQRMKKGESTESIAKSYKVTRQAVDHIFNSIKEKVKIHIGNISLRDNSYKEVSEGRDAIESFFNRTKINSFTKKDQQYLKSLLITYPKFYTADQISQDFFDNYYNRNQIIMQSTKLKLTFLLKKKNYVRKYSEEEEQEIIKLLNKGKDTSYVSNKLNIPLKSVISKKGYLSRKGLVPKYVIKRVFNEEQEGKIIEFLNSGYSKKEIAKKLNVSFKSLVPAVTFLVKKHDLKLDKKSL